MQGRRRIGGRRFQRSPCLNHDKDLEDLHRYSPISQASADDSHAFIPCTADDKPPVKGGAQTDQTHSAVLGLMGSGDQTVLAEGVRGRARIQATERDPEEIFRPAQRLLDEQPMPLSLASIIRSGDWEVSVAAEAQADASPPIEVVLALDNTGSMSNDMDTLRDGAETLVEFLLSLDGDTVSVGLVPFVAQVNIGNDAAHLAWMDTTGDNPHHGEFFEDRYMGRRNTVGGACTNAASFPTTFGGMSVTWVKGAAGNPAPYTNAGRCYAFAPPAVNIFDLYNNLPASGAWGGCVEARPEPYDIDDTAPTNGTPATRFVPFFNPDEGGDDTDGDNGDTNGNNWITSGTYDRTDVFGLGGFTAGASVRTLAPYKYRTGVTVDISTSNTAGRGPNRGCPTPIVPLTSNETTVVNAVRDMLHWYGGGTNQVEGLAWAWRVISPGAPFTEGRPYNDPDDPVRKVIVLFTDGDNTSLNSANDALESEYSALAMRRLWRDFQYATAPVGLPGIVAAWRREGIGLDGSNNDDNNMVDYMNDRQALLCEAIKDEGVEIYAIGFDITDGGAAEQLLEDCVTQDGTHYYSADSQAELLQAFDAIGTGIGALRITR